MYEISVIVIAEYKMFICLDRRFIPQVEKVSTSYSFTLNLIFAPEATDYYVNLNKPFVLRIIISKQSCL